MKTIKELEEHICFVTKGCEEDCIGCARVTALKHVVKLIDEFRKSADEFRIRAMKNKSSLEAAAHRGAERALEELKAEIEG